MKDSLLRGNTKNVRRFVFYVCRKDIHVKLLSKKGIIKAWKCNCLFPAPHTKTHTHTHLHTHTHTPTRGKNIENKQVNKKMNDKNNTERKERDEKKK